jgi:serine/threonine protein kinase, bacterial
VTICGANDRGDTVSVIDGATCNGTHHSGCGQTAPTIKVGTGPFGIAVSQPTNTIYVANTGQLFAGVFGHTVSVINGATCDGTNTTGCGKTPPAIPGIGRAPNGIAFDQTTHTVYTANFFDATVSVVNVTPRAIRRPSGQPPRVAVGSTPEAVAVDTPNHTIYVVNSFDGTVSILPERPIRATGAPGGAGPAAAVSPAGTFLRGQRGSYPA